MALSADERAFLDRLLATPGPAGLEAAAQHVVRDWLVNHLPEPASIEIDRNDNLIATVRPKARPRIAMLAHIDTVGLMVTGVDGHGTLRVGPVGRPMIDSLIGQVVAVHTRAGPISGVVFRTNDGGTRADVGDIAIDCGFADQAKAPGAVRPGDYVTWAAPSRELADGRLAAPGADDRLGVFVICQTLLAVAEAGDDGPAVSAVSCIQEEGPTHLGAITTMSRLKPDLIIVVDTASAGDAGGGDASFRLAGGPIIARGGSVHNRTSDSLIELAESLGLPFQIEPIGRGSGTDLESAIQFAGGNAVGCLVSIPQRHSHTPAEVFDPIDLERTVQLLSRFVGQLPKVL